VSWWCGVSLVVFVIGFVPLVSNTRWRRAQATDVAARGLDIPGVEQVVHYHVPLTVEQFVHRSGRTARAQASGFCLTLVSPAEHVGFWVAVPPLRTRSVVMPRYFHPFGLCPEGLSKDNGTTGFDGQDS
jgi:hypothetical protein